jgi:hypothetical protein
MSPVNSFGDYFETFGSLGFPFSQFGRSPGGPEIAVSEGSRR